MASGLENQNIDNVSVGAYGFEVINDTAEHTGYFQAIQFITVGALAALTVENSEGDLTGISIAQNAIIFGKISSITLSSGIVIAYKQR